MLYHVEFNPSQQLFDDLISAGVHKYFLISCQIIIELPNQMVAYGISNAKNITDKKIDPQKKKHSKRLVSDN